jgi:hypothetical protein
MSGSGERPGHIPSAALASEPRIGEANSTSGAPKIALQQSGRAIVTSGPTLPYPVQQYQMFLDVHDLPSSQSWLALYQVHEDLRLVRCWSNVAVVRGDMTYLVGVAPPGFDSIYPGMADSDVDRTQAVVPMTTSLSLTPRSLSSLCANIVHPATKAHFRCITVAIVDRDSTTAYYRVFDTFDEIVHPQWKQKKARFVAAEEGDLADAVAGGSVDGTDDSASAAGDSDSELDSE